MNFYYLRDFLVSLLIACGISATPAVYFSGLFFAFAGAYLTLLFVSDEEAAEKKIELRWILFLAFFVSTCIAMAHAHMWPHLPLQLKMALGGALSRTIVRHVVTRYRNTIKNGDMP